MSTTQRATETAFEGCRPTDATPVTIDADVLEDTTKSTLRTLKTRLRDDGYVPAELAVDARFAEDCSLATQDEVDRIRGLVDAAAFLGAHTLTVTVDDVADENKVAPALEATAERARRDGVHLAVEGALSLS